MTTALLILILLATQCQSPSSPDFPNSSALVLSGGVVYEDNGNGVLGDDDLALEGIEIVPLFSGTSNGQVSFKLDPNVSAITTGATGDFVFEDTPLPVRAVQVRLPAPLAGQPATGSLDYRLEIQSDARNQVAVVQPQACETQDSTCGTPLLPDLQPIVQVDELSVEVQLNLEQPLAPQAPMTETVSSLFPADTWFVEEGDQRLLRFATVAANLGDGPLDILASDSTADTATTWQRIWTDTNHYFDRQAGDFLHHPTHNHVHFDAFERYRLLTSDGDVVAESGKVSFCIRDSVRLTTEPDPLVGIFPLEDCGAQQQSLNVGFGDHYNQFLDDQWIDITGVPAGTYWVEITVDPLDLLVESDESNNTGRFRIELPDPPPQ